MAAGPAATPAHPHPCLQVPKLVFSIGRLLSGVPVVVNGDRCFQSIQRLRNDLDMWSLVHLLFPTLSFFIIIINAFHIHYNEEHLAKVRNVYIRFWQLLSFCSLFHSFLKPLCIILLVVTKEKIL